MEVPELPYEPTLPVVLRRAAAEFGDTPFVITSDETITYAELDERSRALARTLLAMGVGKGTRVGIHFPNSVDWVVAWAAAARVGALTMLFSTLYAPAELTRALRLGDVGVLLAPATMFGRDHEAFLEAAIPGLADVDDPRAPLFVDATPYLRSVVLFGTPTRAWARAASATADVPVPDAVLQAVEDAVVPADELLVIFTSGSTSEPKAVVHTHGGVFRKTALTCPGMPAPGQCVFLGQTFFWVGGILNLGAALQNGATLVTQPKPEAGEALDLIERTRATMVVAWAATGERLRAHPSFPGRDLSFIPQLTMVAGDPTLRHNSLGMTETVGPHTGFARPGAPDDERATPLPERLRGSWGAPLPFIEHKVVDPQTGADLAEGEEGEVCVRGYCVMARRYKHERHEIFDDDGWFHTGDRGAFRGGYLYFTGRLTDMIKTHGANVAPREVELALEDLPDIAQAYVFGVPDADRGEIVAAAVVAHEPGALDLDAVREQLSTTLSSYKVPRRFVPIEDGDVPWLGSGKPDRLRIRELVLAVGDVEAPSA